MTSELIVVQVLKSIDAVKKYREIMELQPQNADENTIRKLFGKSVEENLHTVLDSNKNAETEINFSFHLGKF